MSPTALFALAFGVTLALLVAVVVTGKKRIVKPHIVCVVLTLVALGWTIFEAYKMGEVYDLKSAGIITPIHLTLAKITTFALLAPLVTGVRTLYVPKTRSLHAKLAYVVLALVVVCAVTGVAMILMSNPR
ncbi:MAG: hypothetical protein SGI72_18190 [Planctomycetota bacterium]|nr:hypothetical protein [Planctomycetota bacterium]